MWRRGASLALVLMSGCTAADEPYIPNDPSTTSKTTVVATAGPTNPEVFTAIARAESTADGEAVAFETRAKTYSVTVIADGELYEVTIDGSDVIVNTSRDVDNGIEEFLESQVVTLPDAVDAAAVAHPGRVDSASITFDGGEPVYEVVVEVDDELMTIGIDGYSAEILRR